MSREMRRPLGGLTATLVVVASMVGTGVFTTTGFLVRDLGSNPAVLIAWALGGVMALAGALSYAELCAALPENGGEYQLLSRIYHPALGFVSGFVSLVVGFSAPTAASALAFGAYLERLAPGVPPLAAALGLLLVLAVAHAVRVELGSRVQNAATIGLLVLALGFIAVGATRIELVHALARARPLGPALGSPELAVGLLYVSFAYSGWNAAAYVAGEITDPGRTLPRALVGGTALVTLLYLGLNLVFVGAAPAAELSGVLEIGHVAAAHLFGARAASVVSLLVALALATTVSALLMTGPRVYEKMGSDYPRLAIVGARQSRRGPARAIALQTAIAAAMVLTASFEQLLSYMGFTLALFSGLTVAGVFVLRRREPKLSRPYRVWGYPVTPLVAIALSLWMIVHALAERPAASLAGIVTLAVGVLLWWLAQSPVGNQPRRLRRVGRGGGGGGDLAARTRSAKSGSISG